MQNGKRSDAALKVADSWAKRFKSSNVSQHKTDSKDDREIIIISDEESDPDIKPKLQPKPKQSREFIIPKHSPFRLISNPGYDTEDVNNQCVTLEDLVTSKELKKSYQFSFAIDLRFFLPHINPSTELYFITGSPMDLDPDSYPDLHVNQYTLRNIIARMEHRYGSHHTKMMINFFKDVSGKEFLQVVIFTANLTALDFNGMTQMCWSSGKLPLLSGEKGDSNPIGLRFKEDLTNYLKKYRDKQIDTLKNMVSRFDFSSVHAEFVSSAPGEYNIGDKEVYGYGKLHQVLSENNLFPSTSSNKFKILSLVSSIASPFMYNKASSKVSPVFSHLLCPLIAGQPFPIPAGKESFDKSQVDSNYDPILIYPTVGDVARSNIGYLAGQAIHYHYYGSPQLKLQHQLLLPIFHKWSSENAKRHDTPSHAKLYMTSDDDWGSLKWVLLTSSNQSKQAWGSPTSGPNGKEGRFTISSYEVGVLIHPGCYSKNVSGTAEVALKPVFGQDTLPSTPSSKHAIPIRLPFDLPPTKYGAKDKPWSPSLNFSQKDRLGNTYSGLNR